MTARRRGGSGRRPEPRIVDIDQHPRARVCLRVAGDWLGLSIRTVQARIESGALEGYRDGQRWSVPIEALKAYRAARQVAP